jgi:hypothetical protein
MGQGPRQFGHILCPSDVRQSQRFAGDTAFLSFCLGSDHRSIASGTKLLNTTKLFIVDLRYASAWFLSMQIPDHGGSEI